MARCLLRAPEVASLSIGYVVRPQIVITLN